MTLRTLPNVDQLPRALYRAEQVREFDRLAIEQYGIPGEVLMGRAGQAAFQLLRQRWPDARRLAVLVGSGNNGGDGFVVARLAKESGFDAVVGQVGDRERLSGDAALNATRWRASGGEWKDGFEIPEGTDVIVDALLGTGLERVVGGRYADAIAAINAHRAPCLAIDLPSGLHADSGIVMGSAVRASATISFIGLKQGLFTADGPDCAGEISFAGLDVPAKVFASTLPGARRIDWHKQIDQLPRRAKNSHKGHYGHTLVIGGNDGFGGAGRLAAEAALRAGSGLVSLLTRPTHVAAVLAARPEIMVNGIDDPGAAGELMRQANVIAIGPGLGRDDWAMALWQQALKAARPLVVDADALHLLAGTGERRDDWVLTPHPGEAAVLLGLCNAEVNAQRFDAVDALQRRYGGGVVLKGCGSLIASDSAATPALCSDGNPGMASGGMGDVLTGVIAGLMAQGVTPRDAAETGVCLHAAAGDAAARDGQRGLLAGDLIAILRQMVNP